MKRITKIYALIFALVMVFSASPLIYSSAAENNGFLNGLFTKKVSDCKITVAKTASYTGKKVKAKVVVKNGKTTLKEGTHYKLAYSSNKKIGTAKVKITGIEKGGYKGSKTYSFKIVPAKPKISQKNKTTSSFTLSWKKVKGAKKYIIYKYDTKKKKYVKVKETEKTSFSVKKLSSAKKYTYAVKAYAKKNYVSDYSKTDIYTKPGAVKSIKVKASGSSATLSVKKVTRATGYAVYTYNAKTKKYKRTGTTKKLTYTIKNLKEKTSYTYYVAAYYGSTSNIGAKKKVTFKTTALPAVPVAGKVTGLKATVKGTDIILTWNKAKNAMAYNVYSLDENGKLTLLKTTSELTFTHKKSEGTAASYCVSALNSVKKEGEKSDTKTAYIPLSAVKNLSLSLSGNKLVATWDKKDKATSYTVYHYDTSKKSYSAVATVKEGTSHSEEIKDGTAVSLCVSADFTYGKETLPGEKCSTKSYILPLEAVSGLKASSADEASIKLSWNKKDRAEGYNVYSYNADKKTYSLISDAGNSTSCEIKNLKAGTDYSFAVSGYFYAGGKKEAGKYSSVISASTVPSAPSSVSLDDRTETSVTFKWSSSKNADAYSIYSYNASEGSYKKIADTDKTSFTVTGLEKGKAYNYAVSSVSNKNGTVLESKKGEVVTFSTLITPGKVTGLKTSVKSNKATVSWKKTDGAQGYTVYSVGSDGKLTALGSVENSTQYVFNIPNGKAYTVAVKAYVKSKSLTLEGEISDSEYVILPFDKVKNLKFVSATEYSVTLSWDKKEGAEGYDIFSYNPESQTYTQILDAGTNTTFSVKNLEDNKSYTYAVGAYFTHDNQKITGIQSDIVKATTKPYIEVSNMSLTAYSETTMNIKWHAVDGAKSYNVYRYNPDSKTYTLLGNSKYPLFIANELEKGKSYQFAVSVIKDVNGTEKESSKSDLVTAYSTKTMPQNMKKVFDTVKGNTFSIKYAVPLNDSQTIPTEFYYKNENYALVANMSMEGLDISSRTLYLKDKNEAYILIPMGITGFYTKMSASDLVNDGMDAGSLIRSIAPEVNTNIPYTVTQKLYDGKTYTCESFVSATGSVITYYFYNGKLTDIEEVNSKGTVSLMNITSLSTSVDDKIFKLPTLFPVGWTYIDM